VPNPLREEIFDQRDDPVTMHLICHGSTPNISRT
jgi:hypothetical protein